MSCSEIPTGSVSRYWVWERDSLAKHCRPWPLGGWVHKLARMHKTIHTEVRSSWHVIMSIHRLARVHKTLAHQKLWNAGQDARQDKSSKRLYMSDSKIGNLLADIGQLRNACQMDLSPKEQTVGRSTLARWTSSTLLQLAYLTRV